MGDGVRHADRCPSLPLVDVRWLRAHTADAAVLAVEVGADSAAYFEGHVPGAVPLAWLDDLHDPVRRGIPTQQQVERLLSRRGVTPETRLVLYGETDTVHAAYAYWLLRYYRHPHVSLLDGGRAAWTAAGGALVQDVPERPVTCYRSPGPDPELRATRELVLARYVEPSGGRVAVDCRRPDEFAGGTDNAVLPALRRHVGGHLPGAQHVPHTDLLEPGTGRLQPREVLRERFGDLAPTDDIVVYCDLGERSSLTWFVLHDLLSFPHVRVYDGGWSEYGSLVDVPIAR